MAASTASQDSACAEHGVPQVKAHLPDLGAVTLQAHGNIVGLVQQDRRRSASPGRLAERVQVEFATSQTTVNSSAPWLARVMCCSSWALLIPL